MIRHYLRVAIRNLFRHRTSSVINISGLAVGMATGIVILLVILHEWNYDQFHSHLRDTYLVMKNQQHKDDISTGEATAGPLAAYLRANRPEVKYASRLAYFGDQVVKIDDKALYGSGIYAEPDLFHIMTFPAIQGDVVRALSNGSEVVLTASGARRYFGQERAMGKTITIDKTTFLVGAVIQDPPTNSTIRFDMVIPFSYFEQQNTFLTKWDDNRIQTWVQLQPAASIASLNAGMTRMLQSQTGDKTETLFAYPFARLNLYGSFSNGKPDGGKITMLKWFGVLAFFVIFIACINFMNIATARSEHRSREVGVRKVMGATRGLIATQFLGEAMVASFISLLLALLLAQLFIPYFNDLTGNHVALDLRDEKLWLLLGGVGLITGFIAGSYPAFFMSAFRAINVLKGIAVGRRKAGLRKTLVTIQFVFSIFLMMATIFIYRQIDYVRHRPLGYSQDHVMEIMAQGDLPDKFDLFKTEAAKIAGVEQITAGTDDVVNFGGSISNLDYPGKVPGQDVPLVVGSVGYDWTRTLQIKMVQGRDFSPAYGTDTIACILNETAVQKMGLKQPLGSKVGGCTVIGVFNNIVFNNPSGRIAPVRITLKANGFSHFFVRIGQDGDQQAIIRQIESVAKKLNPGYPVDHRWIRENYEGRFAEWSSFGAMSAIFGGLAIFIACLGLFGLAAYVAERRGKEISIRKVFGADSRNIFSLLSRDFLKPVFIALLIVFPASAWLGHWFLSHIAYHGPLSWWMFALAAALTLTIALATIGAQTIRAAVAAPADKLRTE